MSNSGAAISSAKPDPTKWNDRIGEFSLGAAYAGCAVAIVGTAATAAAGASNVGVASGVASVTAVCISAVAANVPVFSERSRPLARKLGVAFPALAALAAGGLAAHLLSTAPVPPEQPAAAGAKTVLQTPAENAQLVRIQQQIEKIKARGLVAKSGRLTGPS